MCKNKGDASNNRSNWNHLKVILRIPELHIGKARNQELQKTTTLNSTYTLWKVVMSKT